MLQKFRRYLHVLLAQQHAFKCYSNYATTSTEELCYALVPFPSCVFLFKYLEYKIPHAL